MVALTALILRESPPGVHWLGTPNLSPVKCKWNRSNFGCGNNTGYGDGPTKRPQYMRISRLITMTYLQNNFSVIFRQWQPAKPRTGTSIIWIFLCQTVSIWQQHWLWRWQLIDTFSGPFTDPLLSGIIGLFLHVGCIPQQKSIRLFWASVCVCVSLYSCACAPSGLKRYVSARYVNRYHWLQWLIAATTHQKCPKTHAINELHCGAPCKTFFG